MLGTSRRCVVCGTCAVVVVMIDDATLAYCSHDWLAVEMDGITADAIIYWVNDRATVHQFAIAYVG